MTGSAGIIKPGLERIFILLKYLGNPQEKFSSIRIAGTNGKGSTAYFLNSVLIKTGATTGLYTSPHIRKPEERIRVSNALYEGDLLHDMGELEKSVLSSLPKLLRDRPTFFELATAVALDYFRQKRVDVAVLETGLGGRLDATAIAGNIGDVLTDVSLDHTEYLGNSIEEILLEKIGHVKGMFLVSSSLPHYLGNLVKNRCKKTGCHLSVLGRNFFFEKLGNGAFNFTSNSVTLKKLWKTSPGDFQYRNAAIAAAAALKLGDHCRIEFEKLSTAIREGIKQTCIPARFEMVSNDPLVLLDVGHNYLSSWTLRHELVKMRRENGHKTVCVFTMMRNRNPVPFLKSLLGVTDL
ncbi:MAG: hypothetical protein GTN70_04750, partial [Deltaproteobacteria bacterium]|nr:hypothetical protein [Deltaproteobacteria bacterium]NIS76976.1 hypothetical protein [Deltaproteobacteria bacterium]